MTYDAVAQRITEKTGIDMVEALGEDLAGIANLRLPSTVIDFYVHYEPMEVIELNGVRLLGVREIEWENRDFAPGADLVPHGCIVVAITTLWRRLLR